MKSCEEYQVAWEMHRRGALDPAEAAEVQAHVGGCPVCQRADSLARAVEEAFHRRAQAAAGRVGWPQIDRRVRMEATALRAMPWVVLGSFLVIAVGGPLLFDAQRFASVAPRIAGLGALGALGSWVWSRARVREARQALELGGEELLVFRRKQLDREIAEAKQALYVGPALGVACALGSAWLWKEALVSGVALLALAVAFVASSIVYGWRKLPRLRRERATLT